MNIAIGLAKKGVGRTSPNPQVGAVVVRDGKVVGKGFHKMAGLPHAEVNALKDAGSLAKGADLYVTLEPCDHYGKTPPCTDTIIKSSIKRVFVGMEDPNPVVSGKGVIKLRKKGIAVNTGILEEECRKIDEPYIKYITTNKPYVILKLAAALDGRIATASGESKWITSEKSREYCHNLRMRSDAVMVGIGTVLRDNPLLTVRLAKKNRGIKNPVRVVIDSRLRIPLAANVFNTKNGKLIIATTKYSNIAKIRKAEQRGAEVIVIGSKERQVDLKKLMTELGGMGITSILIEGGSRLAASAIRSGIVDRLLVFYAPVLLGGDGVPMIGSLNIKRLVDAVRVRNIKFNRIGSDILLEGEIVKGK
ncbi:MAG TPA: bifunctional diaminohydroxyphosphoribosylaminopyrimidine deaminase/5-amino-6-(5-phosphoribosylamino)uracil reductase RibD [Deltaproteobacteria bacterium]|nr:bifunctional diaminohydroxyphosphoribosylaminopyrimidine deaminase/5-amino-6-(5-phosphoribosylamino)uracil reductase RibD [Deltaproteobacteria bacterium]